VTTAILKGSVTNAWWQACAGRLLFLTHVVSGHDVSWRVPVEHPQQCPGDIVCHDCGVVLWCRVRDPWRSPPDRVDAPMPHLTTVTDSNLVRCQRLLRLADGCPAGGAGDEIRRFSCELIEAASIARRSACRRRLRKALVRVAHRHSRGRARPDDPRAAEVSALSRAVDAIR